MHFPVYPYLAVCLANSIVIALNGVWVWKLQKGKVVRRWAWLSLLVAAWVFLYTFQLLARDPKWSYWLAIMESMPVVFVPPAYLAFLFALIGKEKQFRFLFWVSLGIACFSEVALFSGKVIAAAPAGPFWSYFTPGPMYWPHFANVFLAPIFSVVIMVRELRSATGRFANQLFYVLLASIVGFTSAESTIPIAFRIPILPYPMFFFWLYPLIITYAIIRHRLMDITVVIRKSLIYSLTLGVFTALLLIGVFFVAQFFSTWLGPGSIFVAILTLAIAGIALQPLRAAIEMFLDRIFFRRRYEYSKALRNLMELVAKMSDTPAGLRKAIDEVRCTVGTRNAALYIAHEPEGSFIHIEEQSTFTAGK